jgi:lysozyme
MMQMSSAGLQLLQELEGCVLTPYMDSGGELTVGVGHLLTRSERHSGQIHIGAELCTYANGLTDAQAQQLLAQDLDPVEAAITLAVHVPLAQHQFDALCCWVFNIGIGAFQDSTLLRLLNQGRYDEVPAQLRRWNKDNGEVVQGLINRRAKEIACWRDGIYA